MNTYTIQFNKRCTSGKLQNKYSPLQNLMIDGVLNNFQTSHIIYNFHSPIEVDCQLSYDDSINLILNNNQESPRLINTTFARLGNNNYEYIIRNQKAATNIYNDENLKNETDLFIRSFQWPIIDLKNVEEGGQLMGGNYIFYLKYSDEDGNQSDIISESGCITIAHGSVPNSVHGTLADERTSKQMILTISNLDTSYSQFNLYFTRETSDINGITRTTTYQIINSYSIEKTVEIAITGYELTNEISIDALNIKYNYYTQAKTQAIVQNMLFLGNVKSSVIDSNKLQQLSYRIQVGCNTKKYSIGYVNGNYNNSSNREYYDPLNIYYYLGYGPNEYYKLGVVYLMDDGTTSQVFNLLGCEFNKINDLNYVSDYNGDIPNNYIEGNDDLILPINEIINDRYNTGGVFKTPNINPINHQNRSVNPLYFYIHVNSSLQNKLKDLGVVGYFFVRQKRIPLSLFQGLSVGIDDNSGFIVPHIRNGVDGYFYESLIDSSGVLRSELYPRLTYNGVTKHALISLDPIVTPQLRNNLLGTDFSLIEDYSGNLISSPASNRHYIGNYKSTSGSTNIQTHKIVYINEDLPAFNIDNNFYSTRAGNAFSVRDVKFMKEDVMNSSTPNQNVFRGISCPILGINDSETINPSSIYTVRLIHTKNNWIKNLLNNQREYYTISNRYSLSNNDTNIDIYRGDCFTNTVTIRLTRNFIDNSLPTNDIIIDKETGKKFKGVANSETEGEAINLGDLNAVPIGMGATFKCLSNYNLGLRSLNKQDLTNIERLGSYGSFYPLSGISTRSTAKAPESHLLNEGYSVTLGRKVYYPGQPVPYENYHFENRIAFSNVASTKMFTNGFRIFQGLSYQDVDKQFGTITKLFPYGQNLLCIFEHGLAIIPVNEKALLSTQQGMSIHLYGAGVLQEQVSVISPDYGSTGMDSIIMTPNAFYGVDSNARKIGKYNNSGFTCISDFKIQSFLNDNLQLTSEDNYFYGIKNITTHYNNFKGDVIFTFYKNDSVHSLCYNEILGKGMSRQSGNPILSANINNHFFTFDKQVIDSKLQRYYNNQTSIISCNNIYHTNNNIQLKYSHQLYDGILRLKSIKLNDNTLLPCDVKGIIDSNNEFKGIYINPSVQFLQDDKKIYLGLEIPSLPDKDVRPQKTDIFVDKNGQMYVTIINSDSSYEWERTKSGEGTWGYIEHELNLTEQTDSDGNKWQRETIDQTMGSEIKSSYVESISKPVCRIFDTQYSHVPIYYDNGTGINGITNSTLEENGSLQDYQDNDWLLDDDTLIHIESVIPFMVNNNLFCFFVRNQQEKKGLSYELFIDSVSSWTEDIKLEVEIQAIYGEKILDNSLLYFSPYTFTNISLGEHDINSPVTNWYDKQHPFELEFVVNEPSGMHKIFNNLIIISNNVEPESLEVEIIGDVYDFPKENILHKNSIGIFPEIIIGENKSYVTTIKKDRVTQEYSLLMHQDSLNIKDFGRRLGNISYVEGKGNIVLQPIYYKQENMLKTTRLRDKGAKIRIKYSGDKLAIITAIQTLMTISYV